MLGKLLKLSLEVELPHYACNEIIHKIQLLTSNKISKSYGGDSDEWEIEAFNVIPSFSYHEDKGRNNQMDQDTPNNENSRACYLGFPLWRKKKKSGKYLNFFLHPLHQESSDTPGMSVSC